ncbi:MAG: hypothetical protein KatS3mg103_1325 [Phycisphaerales bacterium]|nr:MAG: hypothetical protein KatS3mg103_1325 [Phycisphaerales bacterium]
MEIRQRSLGQLQAAGAQVTTTGFFRPHLALGASTLTLNIDDGPPGRRRLLADARHVTAQVLGVPVLYWPVYVGDPSQIPLRNVSLEFGDRHGEVVRTTWDGFALLGAQPPAGVDLDLLIDAYFRRGPGLGGNLTWTGRAGGAGSLLVYGVVNDTHRDLLPTGARIDRTGQGRTVALLEHIGALNDRWTLRAEGAWLSDENVVGAYFPQWTTSRREPTNALSVQRIDRSSMLLLGASVQANDFLVTDAALRSRGYAVERLPELRYARPADDLLADARPGLITLRSDSRAGLLRMRFTEPTAAELGFPSVRRAQAALGIDPSQSPGDRLRAQGLDESAVFRATTEHELSGRVDLGPLRLRPFAVGRLTGYDTDFDDFAASTGRDADALVASGGVGLTASTELTRIYDGLFVPALDIDRLRHVVEPSATLWYGDSTVAQGAIPTFDEQVERFARGPAVRIGVDQTFQTMRGSLGTQQSVDLLRVGLHVVFAGRDRPEPQRTPRFDQAFVHRSELGDFADLWAAWRVTDALGLTGRLVYDLQADRAAEAVAGVEIDHWPATRLFAELRRLGYSDDTYANAGVQYELSDRYTLRAEGTYNDKSGQFQSASLAISRRMPHLILTGRLTYDDITGQTSLGVDVVPAVADTAQQRIDRLGSAMLGLP